MIPLFRPSVTDAEILAVTRVLRSGWWGQGQETEDFEAEFEGYVEDNRYHGGPHLHAAAVNSGTAALELSARALMPEGGLAIVPAFTFISSALALEHAGLDVMFADIREDTQCIDWDHVSALVEQSRDWNRTLVAPVWYGGFVPEPPEGLPWQVKVLEDCAHAAGSENAGAIGNVSAWSFHAVKNLATGDGGMVVSADEELISKVKRLRWLGISKSTYDRNAKRGYSWDYAISEDGEKAHMNDITAALGRVQLSRLDDLNEQRRTLAREYKNALRSLEWLRLPIMPLDSSHHLFTVRVFPADRDRFIDHLRSKGVSAGVHYKPLYKYPKIFPGTVKSLPVTEKVFRSIVTLPLFPDMTFSEQDQVISAVRSFRPSRQQP